MGTPPGGSFLRVRHQHGKVLRPKSRGVIHTFWAHLVGQEATKLISNEVYLKVNLGVDKVWDSAMVIT